MKVTGKAGGPVQTEAATLNKTLNKTVKKTTPDTVGEAKKRSAASAGLTDGLTEAFAPGNSSKVDLSSRAQDIRKAKELATPKAGDIDEAKVARLQKLIDAGKYNVDAEAVADRLVDEHLLTST
jgi:negative regulator of flagellin synthesis FlgM